MIKALRKELRLLNPGVNVDIEEIKTALTNEVLKREVQDGDKATEACKRVAKSLKKREKENGPKPTKSVIALSQSIDSPEEVPGN